MLLLDTMVRHEVGFQFSIDRQVSPNGSFSQIVDQGKRLDLFGSRLSKVSTYDKGMVCFFQCLKEFGDHAEAVDHNFKLPFTIEGDKIGPPNHTDRWCSVKRGLMHDDEEWTHALKYMLTNLKFLTTRLSLRQDLAVAPPLAAPQARSGGGGGGGGGRGGGEVVATGW